MLDIIKNRHCIRSYIDKLVGENVFVDKFDENGIHKNRFDKRKDI